MHMRIAKDLVVDGEVLVEREAWSAELDAKHAQVVEWLRDEGLNGVLIRRNENIAWLTGGAVELRVRVPNETGVAAALVTSDGRRYYFTTANEAPRLHDEEFGALDFEPVIFPWYEDRTEEEALRLAGPLVASDTHTPGFAPAHLYPLRAGLQDTEIERFRWLGAQVADAVSEILQEVEPEFTEYDIEALVAADLLGRGILPSVYLMAVDERIYKYKHAVARGRSLEKYGMINLCARKWGLTVSMTRFVHFGPPPAELPAKFEAAAQVNAALLHATRVGTTSAQLFAVAKAAYAEQGFAGDEQLHHQGGATGYLEREWIAKPDGKEQVVNSQAFAWNPSIRGGKAEDTVVLVDGAMEWLTETPDLPVIAAEAGGRVYRAAGLLVR